MGNGNQFTVIALLFLIILNIRTSLLASKFKDSSENYGCICPSFRREVCIVGPAGTIRNYKNLCVAKCSAQKDSQEIKIGPRSACQIARQVTEKAIQGQDLDTDTNQWAPSNNSTIDEWIRDVKKEATVWKKVNQLLTQLLQFSSGGAPPCICPSLSRTSCNWGKLGIVEKHDNLCTMKCQSFKDKTKIFGLGSCANQFDLTKVKHPKYGNDEQVELGAWYNYMEQEIEFYRKVSDAMSGLFPETI